MGESQPLTNWKTQFRKGFMDLFILNCLNQAECYGYDLVQLLKRHTGTAIREGIIYPILARMQADGLVTSEKRPSSSGPPRKYYHITSAGRRVLAQMNAHWNAMVAAMETIRHQDPEENGHG